MKAFHYFTPIEWILWILGALLTCLSYLWSSTGILENITTLIGITSLIFTAKGNPVGPFLMIFFCFFYGIISYSFAYYGEMFTYLGMSLPMAVISLLSWLRHPHQGKRSEVQICAKIHRTEKIFVTLAAISVTVLFYFLLRACHTANLLVSTISVTTSFFAAYFTFRRHPYYAFWYALNDLVLITLWIYAARKDPSYLSVLLCFSVFFLLDVYGFFQWKKMSRCQETSAITD